MLRKQNLAILISVLTLIGADKAPISPSEIVAQAPQSAWAQIDPDNIIIAKLPDGTQFVFELATGFAPVHADNIKKMVRAGYFDKTQIVRVQDNYVVQWGAPENTQLPLDIVQKPPAEYEFSIGKKKLTPLPYKDAYAKTTGYIQNWPVGANATKFWLPHCYGMIGVGRDMAPDTGTGGELYAVIGHAPRHLDRNITLIGRVLAGMENLTNRPRGTAEMGFYKEDGEKIPFISFKIAADLPQNERPQYFVMDTQSKTFASWVKARANRGPPFFIKAANAVDICNALPPIKRMD